MAIGNKMLNIKMPAHFGNYRAAFYILGSAFYIFASSCSIQQQISRSAKQVITDSSLQAAHIGISIYEPAAGKYWYNYQGDKYFVPASNTKIPTCYAAMKYLGDSLAGLRYYAYDSVIAIVPTADPTFLHNEFTRQPVYDFLKNSSKRLAWGVMGLVREHLGSGWAWNDYNESYMAERSEFPVYGNLVTFDLEKDSLISLPSFFAKYRLKQKRVADARFFMERILGGNTFYIQPSDQPFKKTTLPFATYESMVILEDTLKKEMGWLDNFIRTDEYKKLETIRSQPADSLLKPMMHRSDNFFAEQVLLMVSNERLGVMKDEKIIDTLLATDLKDLPQKPRWADGSGLSRYNLFTPQDFVVLLAKMQNEFGMERLKVIFPTGGEGTISSYYKADSGYIYAKTGTLSGVVAFSGYLYTRNNKLLVFSVLVNNHRASATAVRRAVEKFLQGIRRKY
jgi:serine-type D-Ala-D-Ala carboxypeptidase/endopeptidase (penicillin-binding protein 4)